jgi:small conductance mechanosensitive channel
VAWPRPADLLDTRTDSWREVGLARQLSRRAVKRARVKSVVLLPLLAGTLLLYAYRDDLFGRDWDEVVRTTTAILLVVLGWEFAREAGRAFGPTLFRHMQPGTAGTVAFLIRLGTLALVAVVALRVAGVSPRDVALGSAVTAVIVGLAAQQTLGHLFAGIVLLSARVFRVGERVRLHGGSIGGSLEGVVSSLGLLHTTLVKGENSTMIPNSIVLSSAVVPLRQPAAVDLRVHLRPGVTPIEVQELLESEIETPMRDTPRVTLEELDGDQVVARISATPQRSSEGPRLASEVLSAIGAYTARAG